MPWDRTRYCIGVMDVFSILLPGALLTYLLMREVGPFVLGDRVSELDGAEAWAAFLFTSYLVGHLVCSASSWLDEFYDWAHRYTLNAQIATLARRGRLLPFVVRTLIWMVFKAERNLAVDRTGRIKQQLLGGLRAGDPSQSVLPRGHGRHSWKRATTSKRTSPTRRPATIWLGPNAGQISVLP